MKKIILFLMLLFLPKYAFAQFYQNSGLGVGARAIGMGGAFVAIANDPSAAYWNPSGLGLINKFEFLGMYGNLFSNDITNTYFSIAWPMPHQIHLSISRNELYFLGLSGSSEQNYSLAISIPLMRDNKLFFGAELNYFYSNLENNSSSGEGLGFGFLYTQPVNLHTDLKFGINVSNLFSELKYTNGFLQNIPEQIASGLAMEINKMTTVAVDGISYVSEHQFQVRIGAEQWILNRSLAFRVGYINFFTIPAQITFGIGWKMTNVELDYAFESHSSLGYSHRISLTWYFPAHLKNQHPQVKIWDVKSMVGNKKIYLSWKVSNAEGKINFNIYIKKNNWRNYFICNRKVISTQYCLIHNAINFQKYNIFVRAVTKSPKRISSRVISVEAHPMSTIAKAYYRRAKKCFKMGRISEADGLIHMALEYDSENYTLNQFCKKLEKVSEQKL